MPVRRFVAFIALLFAASCGGSSDAATEVNVFAAASLADSFAELEAAYEEQMPGIDVRLNIAGSSALREQILAGAPADVFVSANLAVMEQVVAAGAADEPEDFVLNSIVIGVPAGNPAGVLGVEDFANPDLLLGTCAAGVPCGDAALQLFEDESIDPQLDTAEPNVGALVTKLIEGELDAGIVYVSDTVASEQLDAVMVPPLAGVRPTITYSITALNEAPNPHGAGAFIDFAFSERAAMIFKINGFESPARAQ